jgi:hypothetical protein
MSSTEWNGQTSSFVVVGRGDDETGQAIYSLGVGFKQKGILLLIFSLLYPPPTKSYTPRGERGVRDWFSSGEWA